MRQDIEDGFVTLDGAVRQVKRRHSDPWLDQIAEQQADLQKKEFLRAQASDSEESSDRD